MHKTKAGSSPDYIANGKNYYNGIPKTLPGSSLSRKSHNAEVVKAGIKDNKFLKPQSISSRVQKIQPNEPF